MARAMSDARSSGASGIGLVLPVVAVSDQDRAEGLRAIAEVGAAAVVFEADQLPVGTVRQEIPDETPLSGARGHVKDPETGDRRSVLRHVLVPEELVAPAD